MTTTTTTTTWYRICPWKDALVEELTVVKESPKSLIIQELDWNKRVIERRIMIDPKEIFRTRLEALKYLSVRASQRYESARETLTIMSRRKESAEIALANYEAGIQ